MTWADVAVASAFVVGVAAGSVATIRIMRHLLAYLQSQPTKGDEGETGSEKH
jgi:hypothetical protein